jgi:hypothetical protein
MDVIETIRKYIWLVLAIAVVVLSISFYRSCQIDDPYKELYDNLKLKADAQETILLGHITDLTVVIAEKDERISALTEEIVVTTGVMDAHGVTIDELEAALANIPTTDYANIISNLTNQVTLWKVRFTLSEDIIADKDAIIFSMSDKYEAQLIISDDYKTLWETEKELHGIALSRISVLEGKVRVAKFGGTVRNGIILGLGAFIVYGLVTK